MRKDIWVLKATRDPVTSPQILVISFGKQHSTPVSGCWVGDRIGWVGWAGGPYPSFSYLKNIGSGVFYVKLVALCALLATNWMPCAMFERKSAKCVLRSARMHRIAQREQCWHLLLASPGAEIISTLRAISISKTRS